MCPAMNGLCGCVWERWCPQEGRALPSRLTVKLVQREFQDGPIQKKFLAGGPHRPVVKEVCLKEVSLEESIGREEAGAVSGDRKKSGEGRGLHM